MLTVLSHKYIDLYKFVKGRNLKHESEGLILRQILYYIRVGGLYLSKEQHKRIDISEDDHTEPKNNKKVTSETPVNP